MSHEFELIDTFFKPLSTKLTHGEVGIGDDGAVLNCPANQQLVVVTDTLIAGRHFPENTDPFDIAWKALAVNLSDLAAMGATPAFFSLALTLSPSENNQAWLSRFSSGLKALADESKISLIGGDTTKGHLSITITAQGWVPSKKALLRCAALPNEDIYVSGQLGDGGLGLANILGALSANDLGYSVQAVEKLNRPQPRLDLGEALRVTGLSKCAIDISDGFLADLSHILEASDLSATLYHDLLPLSPETKAWAAASQNPLFGLNTGDDYELCFTANPSDAGAIQALALRLQLPLTKVGQTRPFSGQRLQLLNGNQAEMVLDALGYQHF